MKRMKLMLCGIALLLLVPVIGYQAYDGDTALKAETVIDDSPLGEKIVDIKMASLGRAKYALTENGNVYSWGTYENLYTGVFGGLGHDNYDGKPHKVLNAETNTDGEIYLSNIIKIYANGALGPRLDMYGGSYVIAVASDGKVYGWGDNRNNTLGLPEAKIYTRATEIILPDNMTGLDIGCIEGSMAALFITNKNTGEVYVSGKSTYGSLGLGAAMQITTSFTKINEDIDGNPLPKIKEVAAGLHSSYFLTESGNVLAAGNSKNLGINVTGQTMFKPTYLKLNNQEKLSDIVKLEGVSSWGNTSFMKDKDGIIYDVSDKVNVDNGGYASPVNYNKFIDSNKVFNGHKFFSASYGGGAFIGNDSKLYCIDEFGDYGIYGTVTVVPYVTSLLNANYTNAKKILAASSSLGYTDLVLSNTGAVYDGENKVAFGDIIVTAKKTNVNATYKHQEKYNDSVSILSNTANIGDLKYREKDLINGTVSEDKIGSSSIDISLNNNERIYKTYEFYLNGQEAQTKTSFTVDLYKKEPTVDDVKNNGVYQPGKAITLGYNGFSENTLSAKLKKKNEEAIAYSSGTPINNTGFYELIVTDQYGNTRTYNFEITDKPVAESISFTKNPNGELIYANSITKANNQIGTISLVYPAGTSASTIASASVKDEGDGVNFEIKNNNQLYVKTNDLTAKEYTVPIEGTDANGMPFSGDITITIAKATQTMAWDETSARLATDGVSLGDEITLGVKDVLGNASVTYGLKTPNSCITMTANKAKVTCIPSPASVTFTATPSGNDNYTSEPIELTASISKKTVSLKTVIQDSDGTYKDSASVKVGSSTPNAKVVDSEGNEVAELGTPSIVFKKNGTTFADPTIEAGTYSVEATYPSGSAADNYTITWTSKATLVVSDIVIDENNALDYYTLTSDGKPYTPDTWTNQAIIITPVHSEFNLMSVENANASASPYSYSVEGRKEVKLTFATADGAKASTKVTLNYDKTNPVLTSFQYDDVSSPVRSLLNSLFGFTHYFDKEKAVRFLGSDEATGSGVKEYTYEIIELNSDGTEIANTLKTGKLDSVNTVKLEMDKNYKITAKVIDNAGNESAPLSETVQLNDEIGELNLSASSDGKAYDGSKWTSKAIDITLTGTNKSGVKKYQYSIDGSTFIDFTSSDGTITLPSPLVSIDNKTYTFRAVNNDGTTNDKTLIMKVDSEAPIIKVKGMIGGNLYDGGEVDTDVTIVPYQENESLSDITYYYTNEESSKNSDPLTDANWKKYSGLLSETRNGSHTYYFKGINGAGVQSDVVDITIKIAKKEYTKVNVSVTSENQSYTSGTWAKHDITFTLSGGLSDESIITGYEYTITKDGSRPASTVTWNRVSDDKQHIVTENSEHETYWFRVLPVDPNGSISKGTLINLDVEKPSKPTFTMEEINTNPVARFVNALSFGQWMKAGVKVTIESNDAISGLDHFRYKEISADGQAEKQSQNGILYYEEDANIKLQAIAYDKAGNASQSSEESGSILIDTTPPVIEGVKDKDVYKKYYYVYRTITYHDGANGSGIYEDSAIIKKDGAADSLVQNYKVKDFGSYEVSVKDIAGNEAIVHFQLVPLPDIDTEIDGSDESRDIIDQVQKELEEERENLSPDEIKDFEKWIEDAEKKWESERKKKLEDKETGTIVEGEGDTSFDPNTELIVDKIDETKIPELPRKAIHVYDVYMKKGDTVIQPDGSVKVYLPYNEEEEPIIYEIDEDGNVKEIKGTKENGYVSFITDKLKKYAISNEAQEENKKPEPDAGTCTAGPDGKLGTADDVCGGGNGKDEPTKNEDGSVDVPDGGTIHFPDKEIDAPDGGHINPDGSVVLPDGTEYDKDGNKKPKVCEIKNGIILNKDSDGDGLPDINLDIDNDCFAELNIDLNKDGIPDLDIDSDGDGKPDINVDVNGDGNANLNLLKLSTWTPNKDDCVVDGFHYDTMSGLKPASNIDSDGDGKADTNITDKDGNPIDTSVKANYNSSNTQGVGGAGTGDSTKWFLWALCMILTLCTMCIHVYRSHKRKYN